MDITCIYKIKIFLTCILIQNIVIGQSIIKPIILVKETDLWETLPDLPGVADIPTLPVTASYPKINCASQNFIKLNKCCNKHKEIFFSDKVISSCSHKNNTSFLSNFTREYVLNKFQRNSGNSLDLRTHHTSAALSSATCFVECLYKTRRLIFKSNTINYDKVMERFVSSVDETMTLVIEAIINTCRMNIEIFTKTKIKLSSKTCLTKPMFLMQCIRKNLLLTCPADLMVNSTVCDNRRRNLKICELF